MITKSLLLYNLGGGCLTPCRLESSRVLGWAGRAAGSDACPQVIAIHWPAGKLERAAGPAVASAPSSSGVLYAVCFPAVLLYFYLGCVQAIVLLDSKPLSAQFNTLPKGFALVFSLMYKLLFFLDAFAEPASSRLWISGEILLYINSFTIEK